MNDAILGWLAGLFFYDPPTDPVDEVKEKAREVCSELKARGSSKFERLATSGKAIRENLEGE